MENQQRTANSGSIVRELFQTGMYKRNQGRMARSLTAVAIGVVSLLAAWRISMFAGSDSQPLWRLYIPSAVVLGGCWLAYRVVNWPSFADFLISVEAEMAKVSWPSRVELFRSVAVVVFLLVLLVLFLFVADLFWAIVLQWIVR
jgi:preprotein translocase subunit SecE